MSSITRRSSSLSGNRALLNWLRNDPRWSELALSARATQAWRANWNTINASLSRSQLHDRPPLESPILVLGPWRSGTTVMHELLTAATGLPTPRTWQSMDACAFMLTGAGKGDAVIARPMDGLEIGAQTPQEDEFALLSLGADSAYRAFLAPHRLRDLKHTLDQSYWLDDTAWLAPWEQFMQGVLASENRTGKRLILKSPNHTFRLQAILRHFPDTKLVWMCRDPAAVFHSNRKMWRTMFDAHALWPGVSAELDTQLDQFLAEALQRCAETLHWLLDHVAANNFSIVTQSDLRDRPIELVQAICARLGLTISPQNETLTIAIERSRRGLVDQYTASLPSAAQDAIAALHSAQQRALTAV